MPTATTSPADLHDPTSAAYKRARRRHIKATRNRHQDVEADWTLFRAAEKTYKARFPPPDLADVLDLAALDETRQEETSRGGWCGRGDAVTWEEMELHDCSHAGPSTGGKAYIFPDIPGMHIRCADSSKVDQSHTSCGCLSGLVLLPSFVGPDEQKRLVRWALCEQALHPNETNLDTHYVLPEGGLWNKYLDVRQELYEDEYIQQCATLSTTPGESGVAEPPGPRKLVTNEPAGKHNYEALVSTPKPPPAPSSSVQPILVSALVPKLRWANIGWSYHWGTKQYDFSKGKGVISQEIRSLCRRAVQAVRWDQVFANDKSTDDDWGEDGPDWDQWNETYGE